MSGFPVPSQPPVGSRVIWEGTPPSGWLICDGSAFNGAQYPALKAHLGGTVLPDYRNVFPLGAGTKPLGATGGALGHTHVNPTPAVSGPEQQGPVLGLSLLGIGQGANTPHTHAVTIGATQAGDPPYRAVHFIIRAV